jgi:hypothetical protein
VKRYLLTLANLHDRPGVRGDLEAIAARIHRLAPEIDVAVVGRRRSSQWKLLPRLSRPALTVAFGALRKRRLLPGEIFHTPRLPKHDELERLRAAGVPVPDWVVIAPETALDPAEWGPYVVVKPTIAKAGQEVRIRRTERVRYQPPDSFPAGHPVRKGPLLAQRFVYTGPWAVCYRVTTLFGRTLFCWRVEQSHQKRPLESRFAFDRPGGGGIQIIAPSRTSTYTLVDDAEVIELAEAAHRRAFPDYPYLGVDLLRDAETGELSVIEVNSGGAIWHLSTNMGRSMQRDHRMDLYAQFGALDRAAERLIELTRSRARRAPLGPGAREMRSLRTGYWTSGTPDTRS